MSVSKGTLYVVELHYLQVLKGGKRQKFPDNKYAILFYEGKIAFKDKCL